MEEYDEFGNVIGENEGGQSSVEEEHEEEYEYVPDQGVVLHEEKQYYPRAVDVYGEGVEVLVEHEDTEPISKPIVYVEVEALCVFAV